LPEEELRSILSINKKDEHPVTYRMLVSLNFITHMFSPAVCKLIRNFHIGNQLPAFFKAFSVCKFLSEKPNDRFNIQTAQ